MQGGFGNAVSPLDTEARKLSLRRFLLKPSCRFSSLNKLVVRGSVGNASLSACSLKLAVWSAPNEAITVVRSAVVVVVSDLREAKVPTLVERVRNLVVDLNMCFRRRTAMGARLDGYFRSGKATKLYRMDDRDGEPYLIEAISAIALRDARMRTFAPALEEFIIAGVRDSVHLLA